MNVITKWGRKHLDKGRSFCLATGEGRIGQTLARSLFEHFLARNSLAARALSDPVCQPAVFLGDLCGRGRASLLFISIFGIIGHNREYRNRAKKGQSRVAAGVRSILRGWREGSGRGRFVAWASGARMATGFGSSLSTSSSFRSSPPSFPSLRKYFWAWLRIWGPLRVLTYSSTFFQFFPYSFNARRKH